MEVGDFVSVHFEDGCQIGTLESIDGDFVAVSFKMITGDRTIMSEIPKKYCSFYVRNPNKNNFDTRQRRRSNNENNIIERTPNR